MSGEYNPKVYKDEGRTWPDRTDLGQENMNYLRSGGCITILDAEGKPKKRILMDSFDAIRMEAMDNPNNEFARWFFGVPPLPTPKEGK